MPEPGPSHVLDRIFQLTVTMSDAMREDLAKRGLTRPRATLMSHLHRGGPTTQSTLARALRVSPRNVTGLVNGLEALGLVERTPHPTDGRAVLVRLTEDGSRAAAALRHDHVQLARYLFTGRKPAVLHELASELDRLLQRLDDPAFAALREQALQRWPLAAEAGSRP